MSGSDRPRRQGSAARIVALAAFLGFLGSAVGAFAGLLVRPGPMPLASFDFDAADLRGPCQAAVPQMVGNPPAIPDPSFAPGWAKAGPLRTFTGQDLFNQIDGGAELFLEFGFVKLRLQAYARDKAGLTLNAYEMESAASALGVYLMKMGRETPFPEIAARNSSEKAQMTIVKGRYFVQVDNLGDVSAPKAEAVALANAFLSAVAEESAETPLGLLPTEGKVHGSERLVRGPYAIQPYFTFGEGDILSQGGGIFGALAEYRMADGTAFTCLIVPYPDPRTAAAALAHLKANLDPYLKVTGDRPDGFDFVDFQAKKGSVALSGAVLDIRFSVVAERPHSRSFEPFIWKTATPADCPFPPSTTLTGVLFKGVHSDYRFADTWFPSWAADGNLYSPFTDGDVYGEGSNSDGYSSIDEKHEGSICSLLRKATTGQAVLVGDDPLNLTVKSLGTVQADPYPYGGRYPCGSLVHNGVWYYGTYTLAPHAVTRFGPTAYNWPWLGPLVGFRTSTDLGKTWRETPHTPAKPLFGESGLWGYPIKIGTPHFVDFGRNMEHSPDGKAYLVAMGAESSDPKPRFENLSWITADQIYLLRVTPSVKNINDASKYEFYGGKDARGADVWTHELAGAKPLLEWNNHMGCVTVTYDAPLKKYLMCVTDGGNTCARMHTYILEADKLTGPWRIVTFMKDFGQQAYFVNIPSKFIGPDGYTAWLCYSANFAPDWNNEKILANPPGSRYGLVLQEIQLLTPKEPALQDANQPDPAAPLSPAREAPRNLLLRLRHSQEKPIKSVTVDGKPLTSFAGDTVTLALPRGALKIVVECE